MKTALLTILLMLLTVVAAFGQGAEAGCPTISVIGPAGLIVPGEVMYYKAEISSLAIRSQVTYEWTLTNGTIIDGQGTRELSFKASPADEGTNITATVTVKGLPAKCTNTASESAPVAPEIGCRLPIDDYGKIPWLDETARLDSLLITLNNNPATIAFIQIEVGPTGNLEVARKHALKILKHFRQRDKDFDRGRISFAIQKGESESRTTFRVGPEWATMPECDHTCTLLRGHHLLA